MCLCGLETRMRVAKALVVAFRGNQNSVCTLFYFFFFFFSFFFGGGGVLYKFSGFLIIIFLFSLLLNVRRQCIKNQNERQKKEYYLFSCMHDTIYHFFFCVPHVDYIHFLALLCFRTLLLLIIIIIIIIIVGLSVCLVWLSSWTQ